MDFLVWQKLGLLVADTNIDVAEFLFLLQTVEFVFLS